MPETTSAQPRTGVNAVRKPILLWGPPGCGKSTFLACLRYGSVDLGEDARLRIEPADERTADYAAEMLRAVQSNEPTSSTVGLSDPFWFKLEKWTRGKRGAADSVTELADLVIVDPSGDIFKRTRLQSALGQRFLQLLGDARGLVLLIDPTDPNAARTYWDLFADNIAEIAIWFKEQPASVRRGALDERNRLTLPLAVTLTKMDMEHEFRNDPGALLKLRLDRALPMLDACFTRYEVFSSSARNRVLLGSPDGTVREVIRPWGLHEPFHWIATRPNANSILSMLGWTR